MKNNIAIVAVAYNRLKSLTRLLKSLESAYYANYKPTLIISIDKSNTDIVEKYADEYIWPHGQKIVDKHSENLGLRSHMLSLGKWFERFDAIIVLEDDIVISPSFYHYAVQSVNKYSENPEIAGISLYGFEINYQNSLPFQPIKNEYDAYFMNCAMSWGEIWMKKSWYKFYEWYKTHTDFPHSDEIPLRICQWSHKSWLKYHTRYCIEQNLYFVHPYTSLSTNYGDVGEHNSLGAMTGFQTRLQQGNKTEFLLPELTAGSICYDGFFENKLICHHLNIDSKDICVDLYGTQQNRLRKRYWLTTHKADLTTIKTFGMRFRPIDMNIMDDVEGSDIYLYDTECKKIESKISSKAIKHLYRIDFFIPFLKNYGIKNIIRELSNYIL